MINGVRNNRFRVTDTNQDSTSTGCAAESRSSSIRLVCRVMEWGLPEGLICRPAYVKSFRG